MKVEIGIGMKWLMLILSENMDIWTLIFQYILPICIMCILVIFVTWLFCKYSNTSHFFCTRDKRFWTHVIMPLFLLVGCGMCCLMCGGLTWIKDIIISTHDNFLKPLKKTFPICTGVCTTILGLIVMFRFFYPKLKIHPIAAIEHNSNGYWLTMMVENVDWWECYDIEAKLYKCRYQCDNNRKNKIQEPITLDNTSLLNELGWKFSDETIKTVFIETEYCDMASVMNIKSEKEFLELRVSATNPISRVKKVFVQTFNKSDLFPGEFKSGKFIGQQSEEPSLGNYIKKKDCYWRVTKWVKALEACAILINLILIVITVIFNLSYESLNWVVYGLIISISIIEIVRQVLQRPITFEGSTEILEDTNNENKNIVGKVIEIDIHAQINIKNMEQKEPINEGITPKQRESAPSQNGGSESNTNNK